jgi:hypothetical protein
MNNKEQSISLGTVVALGFMVLGILNLLATFHYHRSSINSKGSIPGILFILTGAVVLIVRAVKKKKE